MASVIKNIILLGPVAAITYKNVQITIPIQIANTDRGCQTFFASKFTIGMRYKNAPLRRQKIRENKEKQSVTKPIHYFKSKPGIVITPN